MKALKSLIFCLIVFLGVSSVAKAAPLSLDPRILYVKQGGTSVNCTSWDDACDLQTALSSAHSGDQVWVAAGIYKPTTTDPYSRDATFQLQTGVAIYGGFAAAGGTWETRNWVANLAILSGDIGTLGDSTDNSYHVVTGGEVTATAVLDGFTISAGNANGVYPHNSGGGMYNYDYSKPTLTNVTFSGNTASYGGGMYNDLFSSPTLTNVTFSGNSATYGGGMFNTHNWPTLTNVTISGNSATNSGGGMYNYQYSSPTLTNVTFSGNSATYGGGMYNYQYSSPTLTNVTISGNSATNSGGGMYNNHSSPTLTNVTFSNNTASTLGGGVYNYLYSSPTLTNAIFWGNTPALQIYSTGFSSATITYSDVEGVGVYPGTGNINADPRLGDLANNGGFTETLALGDKSPAIDTANPATCLTYDQRYYARPIDGDGSGSAICDMGAFEYASYPVVFSLTVTVVGNGSVAKNPGKDGYLYGEVVTLTPAAKLGWTFSNWSGDATGAANPLTLTVQGNTSITANFSDQYTLSAIVDPLGSGTVTRNPSEATYTYGTEVALTATANPGWTFSSWSEDASGTTNPLSVTMSRNKSITANFTQDEYTLTVTPIGTGSVIVDPVKTTYHYGDLVTLTPMPTTGWTFSHWSGATVMENKLTITGNTTVTANFSDQYTLLTTVEPTESGTVTRSPDQTTYTYGTMVTLTATANPGWSFSGWSGATVTDNNLTITGNTAVTANFTRIYKLYLPLILRN